MTMPAAPPPEWIDKAAVAAREAADDFHISGHRVAEKVVAAIWPDVLAAVAAHEQQLRQTIANEIMRVQRTDPANGWGAGMEYAADIARGQESS